MRAFITGCAQNSASHLASVFKNIERLRSLFAQSQILILENDSIDDTRALIRDYAFSVQSVSALTFPGLNNIIPQKTIRLAHLRNIAMSWLAENSGLEEVDVVVVLDLDEVNTEPWDLNIFQELISSWMMQAESAAIFANQQGIYYDLWALRHTQHSPDDVWSAIIKAHAEDKSLSDQELLEMIYLPRQFSLPVGSPPLQVSSAFGGLAIYKAEWLKKAQPHYIGEQPLSLKTSQGTRWLRVQCCEHVAFNQQIALAGGSLWIYPEMINWNTQNVTAFGGLRPNPHAWRHLIIG